MEKIRVGDRVSWSSSSAGFSKLKEGDVVLVVPSGEHPSSLTKFESLKRNHRKQRYFLWGKPRNHESYIVSVRSGQKAKPSLYWPRVSALTKLQSKKEETGLNQNVKSPSPKRYTLVYKTHFGNNQYFVSIERVLLATVCLEDMLKKHYRPSTLRRQRRNICFIISGWPKVKYSNGDDVIF